MIGATFVCFVLAAIALGHGTDSAAPLDYRFWADIVALVLTIAAIGLLVLRAKGYDLFQRQKIGS